ncbi:lipid II flippase family protein [Pseudoalteromonas peptidolytica]|uniref:lipid II flippase family protein n=1 Tax=Pseudoalteromonas peptidolytica TaxID=61150 RepID=UPI00298E42E9|nr:DUF2837 family protein [Pseudoalteromonas peptidolytica]MDW7549434.1 DUF2837 family protein [Pseudoalteromonas peptidolytica]
MLEIFENESAFYMCVLVVICFGFIHFLEFSSFLSRIAGIITGSKVTSYTVQQSTFVITRFFFVAMMPLIGLIVDLRVNHYLYLLMIHTSLLFATIFYTIVLFKKDCFIQYFINVIVKYKKNRALIKSLLTFKSAQQESDKFIISFKVVVAFIRRNKEGRRLFFGSAIVFCCYSLGVYISFYLALNFYEYRSSIGQLSGLINAIATVLLTFYIEPKISIAIDNSDNFAAEKVIVLLLGRFIGVAVFSQLVVMILWII